MSLLLYIILVYSLLLLRASAGAYTTHCNDEHWNLRIEFPHDRLVFFPPCHLILSSLPAVITSSPGFSISPKVTGERPTTHRKWMWWDRNPTSPENAYRTELPQQSSGDLAHADNNSGYIGYICLMRPVYSLGLFKNIFSSSGFLSLVNAKNEVLSWAYITAWG